jgi:preprotein translocase subunit YajC
VTIYPAILSLLPITLANSVYLPKVSDHFSIMHLNGLNVLLADAPAATPPPPTWMQIAPFILLPVIVYFLLFRGPQQARKKQEQLLRSLKSGDKVVTASGIVGIIITVKDKTVSLRSADAKMEVTKASVTDILEHSESSAS